jgi:membrane fusion protein (multidrug efflux system)
MRKHNFRKQVLKYLGAAVIVVSGAAACKKAAPGNQFGAPVMVNVAVVEKKKVAFYDNYPGTAVALNEVQLRSEVSGLITGIFFKEGDFVRKGQKLYEIDRSRYLASYGQARANVDIASANVERAQRYVERYTKLSEQDAIARQRVDDAQTDLQNAGLELVSAKAGLVKAQTDLNYSLIMAPFNGTIGISQVKMGALVSPGQTLLNTISSDDPMGVDFVINEKELGRFQELSGRNARAMDSTIRISLPDNSVYGENGKIQVIDRAIDPQTGTIRIRLIFPNHGRKLRAGMSCNAHVLNEAKDEQMVVPLKALLEQMSEYFVFVVDSQKVHQIKVTLGAQLEGKAVITSGVEEGQQVVTDGLQKLRDGAAVIVGNAGSAEANK